MNKQLIDQMKENLSILEKKRSAIEGDINKRQRNKKIGIAMIIIGILGLIIFPGDNDNNIAVLEELVAMAGIIIWVVNWRAFDRAKNEVNAVTSEIGKSKIEILNAENT